MNTQLRKHLLTRRNNLNLETKTNLSKQVCQQILTSIDMAKYNAVVSYSALGNEVDLSCLLNQHKSIYLPVIQPHSQIQFRLFESNDNLKVNRYGILEPEATEIIQPEAIEICFLPLVGFNRKGYRLGMGGGYYDRYFELNKFKKKPTKLVGIAYDFQESDTIQPQPWDIPLDLIITNKEIIEP